MKIYRKIAVLFLVILCVTVYAAVPTGKVIKGIRDRFDQIDDFQASIIQSNVDAKGNKTVYTGEICFKRPEKIRLAYFDKKSVYPSQIAIANDSSLWVYTAELKQITKQKLDPKNLPLPLLVLGGATQIDEHFRDKNYIKPIERVILNGVTTYQIIVKPKTKNPDYAEQTLWVNVKNYLPVKAEVKDTMGNTSIVEFNDERTNQDLPDSLFIMEKKDGVSYVELPN